jgi:hypothetical protein
VVEEVEAAQQLVFLLVRLVVEDQFNKPDMLPSNLILLTQSQSETVELELLLEQLGLTVEMEGLLLLERSFMLLAEVAGRHQILLVVVQKLVLIFPALLVLVHLLIQQLLEVIMTELMDNQIGLVMVIIPEE